MFRALSSRNTSLNSSFRYFKTTAKVFSLPSTLDSFGFYCFNRAAMKDYYDRSTYNQIINILDTKQSFPEDLLDKFAKGVHRWASDRDCTHLTHVFQPLSGVLGEKHDIMFSVDQEGVVSSSLNGSRFISGEPDASSFPNGGTRPTNAARGNTIWDPQSHLTISKLGEATTLRIPSIFYGWNNVALDFKTPLLRSEHALQNAALKCLNAIGDTQHTRIDSSCGLEQEFFLLEEKYYNRRPDLITTGRTLLGRDPSKGQDHSDRYFGWQTTKLQNCIFDMEQEFWKLAIPNSTRHREVAPGQYEMAPTYQNSNQANDNNLMMMQVMKEVASRHSMSCLFHEKPFANVNGSGKHNNWSFGSNVESTFYKPTSKYFLLAVSAFLRGVHLHGDLLRVSIATSGNDHRLGGHEAPPGIMSVYLGSAIKDMVDRAINGEDSSYRGEESEIQDFGVPHLPKFRKQSTDRNRTSPIAFCGNRFEFRAVGSSVNTAWSTTMLNTITADSLNYMADLIEQAKINGDSDPMKSVIQKVLHEHQAVIFEGDGYDPSWVEEAERRGLLNITNTPDALGYLTSEKNEKLFRDTRVLSKEELYARSSVFYNNFNLDLGVELKCIVDLCYQHVLPSAYRQLADIKSSNANVPEIVDCLNYNLESLLKALNVCKDLDNQLIHESDPINRAYLFQTKVRPAMANLRKYADTIEGKVDARLWSLPSYNEMLN